MTTSNYIPPAPGPSQKAMQRAADQRVLDVCRTFNEIQTGPNPLTPAEVSKLIARHPDRYSVLSAWAR